MHPTSEAHGSRAGCWNPPSPICPTCHPLPQMFCSRCHSSLPMSLCCGCLCLVRQLILSSLATRRLSLSGTSRCPSWDTTSQLGPSGVPAAQRGEAPWPACSSVPGSCVPSPLLPSATAGTRSHPPGTAHAPGPPGPGGPPCAIGRIACHEGPLPG